MTTDELLDPIHPGEILKEDFMEPLALSSDQLARELDLPEEQIAEIVNGKHGITADIAMCLEQRFGVSAQVWMNLQTRYDEQGNSSNRLYRLKQEGNG